MKNLMSEFNDAIVLFAAERRLLIWNKIGVACIVLGFLIERFGWLMRQEPINTLDMGTTISMAGIALIWAGVLTALFSYLQHDRAIKTLRTSTISQYSIVKSGHLINFLLGFLGSTLGLALYFDAIAGL